MNHTRKGIKQMKAAAVELPLDLVISDLDSREELDSTGHGEILIETPRDYYLVSSKGRMAFHYAKPNCLPRMLRVEKLELNPDNFSAKVELEESTLLNFARKESLFVFEAKDGYYIPTASFCFFAKKEGGKTK